jgi:hypothetical protein
MDQTRQHDSELASLYAQAGRLQFDALVINSNLQRVNTRIDQIKAAEFQEEQVKAKLAAEAMELQSKLEAHAEAKDAQA